MNHVLLPQEKKLGYYFQSETCPGALKTHVFLSFFGQSSVNGLKQCYPNNIKIPTKKTRPTGYFPIVLVKLFELYTFQLDININCKHL